MIITVKSNGLRRKRLAEKRTYHLKRLEKSRCARCKVARDKNEFSGENKSCNNCIDGERKCVERNKDKIKETRQHHRFARPSFGRGMMLDLQTPKAPTLSPRE